jgi:3-oxoacyl-[acyl-carrier-protein] synthase II
VALVGGSEALIAPGVVRAWEALAALAKPNEHGQWQGPFDALRTGLVLGEGAGCMVLESEEHAKRRSANILADCLGYAQVNDPQCVTHPQVAPQVKAMQQALKNAGLQPEDVHYVNAHATGTRAGDASEIAALNEVFSQTSAHISSTKGATGHLMGAAGVMESILGIQASRWGYPPCAALNTPDNTIAFSLLRQSCPAKSTEIFLTNSFAFGGANVSLVFRNYG